MAGYTMNFSQGSVSDSTKGLREALNKLQENNRLSTANAWKQEQMAQQRKQWAAADAELARKKAVREAAANTKHNTLGVNAANLVDKAEFGIDAHGNVVADPVLEGKAKEDALAAYNNTLAPSAAVIGKSWTDTARNYNTNSDNTVAAANALAKAQSSLGNEGITKKGTQYTPRAEDIYTKAYGDNTGYNKFIQASMDRNNLTREQAEQRVITSNQKSYLGREAERQYDIKLADSMGIDKNLPYDERMAQVERLAEQAQKRANDDMNVYNPAAYSQRVVDEMQKAGATDTEIANKLKVISAMYPATNSADKSDEWKARQKMELEKFKANAALAKAIAKANTGSGNTKSKNGNLLFNKAGLAKEANDILNNTKVKVEDANGNITNIPLKEYLTDNGVTPTEYAKYINGTADGGFWSFKFGSLSDSDVKKDMLAIVDMKKKLGLNAFSSSGDSKTYEDSIAKAKKAYMDALGMGDASTKADPEAKIKEALKNHTGKFYDVDAAGLADQVRNYGKPVVGKGGTKDTEGKDASASSEDIAKNSGKSEFVSKVIDRIGAAKTPEEKSKIVDESVKQLDPTTAQGQMDQARIINSASSDIGSSEYSFLNAWKQFTGADSKSPGIKVTKSDKDTDKFIAANSTYLDPFSAEKNTAGDTRALTESKYKQGKRLKKIASLENSLEQLGSDTKTYYKYRQAKDEIAKLKEEVSVYNTAKTWNDVTVVGKALVDVAGTILPAAKLNSLNKVTGSFYNNVMRGLSGAAKSSGKKFSSIHSFNLGAKTVTEPELKQIINYSLNDAIKKGATPKDIANIRTMGRRLVKSFKNKEAQYRKYADKYSKTHPNKAHTQLSTSTSIPNSRPDTLTPSQFSRELTEDMFK